MNWCGSPLNLSYCKRYKMEIELPSAFSVLELPPGYTWIPWMDTLLETHSEALYRCFRDEIDAVVFPSLGNREGCRQLMTEIRRKPGFLPEATWLLTGPDGSIGTVQGVRERGGMGAIQNIGIVAGHRRRGLGLALLIQALHGFGQAGLERVMLEVTARNEEAVRLYRKVGFRKRKTLYKAVDLTASALNLTHEL